MIDNKLSINKILGKSDNKGSVMVMVLVAFLFVSVLVTTILSTVVVNIKMRNIDRRTKDEFYYAERAINDIYTGIGQSSSDIVGIAYNTVLNTYKKTNLSEYNYNDQIGAEKEFTKNFVNQFENKVVNNLSANLESYIVQDTIKKSNNAETTARAILDSVGAVEYYKDVNRTSKVSNLTSEIEDIKCIVIKKVCVKSNSDANENLGYVSMITTDIVINIPKINFFDLNKSGYDYALLVNDGMDIKGNSNVIVDGNLYAGTVNFGNIKKEMTDSSEYGGINIYGTSKLTVNNADYVISGGDINLLEDTSISSQNPQIVITSNTGNNNQVWFENLSVKSNNSQVDISGSLFSDGDLQVDGDEATVTIKGSYYGYNDGSLSMKASKSSTDYKILTTKEAIIQSNSKYNKTSDGENPASKSSAIIVNGKKSRVDLSGVRTLYLMGNAYINHRSKETAEYKLTDDSYITSGQLPESIALKASQRILLVPSEFILESNPLRMTTNMDDPFHVSSNITKSNWFGKEYIDNTKNHNVVKFHDTKTGQYYAYCYLNFKVGTTTIDGVEMSYQDAYVKAVMDGSNTGDKPTAQFIKSEIASLLKAYDSKVIIEDPSISQRIYAKSSVIQYNDSDVKKIGNNVKSDTFSNYNTNLYRRYRLLDTYMEPLKDIPLSKTDKIKEIGYKDLLKEGNELPFGRFFWLNGIRNVPNEEVPGDPGILRFMGEEIEGGRLIIVRSNTDKGVDIKKALQYIDSNGNTETAKRVFLIVDGNAHISDDITINGFVAIKGKLVIDNGANVKINFDGSLINKRIAKDMVTLKKNDGYNDKGEPSDPNVETNTMKKTYPYNEKYINKKSRDMLTYYLLKTDIDSSDIYANDDIKNLEAYQLRATSNNVFSAHSNERYSITNYRLIQYGVDETQETNKVNTDYMSYIYFDNWKKGQK